MIRLIHDLFVHMALLVLYFIMQTSITIILFNSDDMYLRDAHKILISDHNHMENIEEIFNY